MGTRQIANIADFYDKLTNEYNANIAFFENKDKAFLSKHLRGGSIYITIDSDISEMVANLLMMFPILRKTCEISRLRFSLSDYVRKYSSNSNSFDLKDFYSESSERIINPTKYYIDVYLLAKEQKSNLFNL